MAFVESQIKSKEFNNNKETFDPFNFRLLNVNNDDEKIHLQHDSSSSEDSFSLNSLTQNVSASPLSNNSEDPNTITNHCFSNNYNDEGNKIKNNNENKFEILKLQVEENKKINQIQKQSLTNVEYEMIIEDYKTAMNLNVESILQQYYSNVIEFRNATYNEAKKNNITDKSNNIQRLNYIAKVVEFVFSNIEPPDEHTKKTDRQHFKDVAINAITFCKKKNKIPSVELIVACWLHDIERFIPQIKCRYLPESIDEYRKEVIHPITSARVALAILNGAPTTRKENENIFKLICQHDKSTNVRITINDTILLDIVDEELKETLEILVDADSFTFFQNMSSFVLFKYKTNTKEWIWKRIMNNLKRLRHTLQPDAIKLISSLPSHIMEHIAFDSNQLNAINNDIVDNNENHNDKTNYIDVNNEIYNTYIDVAINKTAHL